MKYLDIRNDLRTGDVLLFDGKGWVSAGIKWMQRRFGFVGWKWSHVGLVVRIPRFDTVFLFESTTLSCVEDVVSGQSKQGPQLVALSERIKVYPGEISVRQLTHPLSEDFIIDKFVEFRREVKDRNYEEDKLELVSSLSPALGSEEDLSSLFCSEMVAEQYQRWGLLPEPPEGLPSNKYTPAQFAEGGNPQLLLDAVLGPEISLEAD